MNFVLPEPRPRSNAHLTDRITLTKGDLIRQQGVDAILSVLPVSLNVTGGLNQALFAAAGSRLDEMVLEEIFLPRSGDAYFFPAENLPATHVLFIMTEDWDGGIGLIDRDLLRIYRRGIEAAKLKGIRRLAVPALITGKDRFPVKRAARLAVQGIQDRLTGYLEEVRIVCPCDESHAAFSERIKGAGR